MATRPRHADVRAEVLAAATEAFERDGYGRASLAGIAAEAGYTKGAVYSGFGSKAALFAEVCTAQFEALTLRALDEVARELAAEGTGRTELVTRLASVLTSLTYDSGGRWPLLLHEFQAVALRDGTVAEEYRVLSDRRVRFLADALGAHPRLAPLGSERLRRISSLSLMLVHTLAVEHRLSAGVVDRRSGELSFTALLDGALPR